MDRLTQEIFGVGKPMILWEGSENAEPPLETLSAIQRIVGLRAQSSNEIGCHIAWLSACPQGSEVRIDGYVDSNEAGVSVESLYKGCLGHVETFVLKTRLVLMRSQGNAAYCRGELADFSPPGTGVGVRYFGMLMKRLGEAGFSRFTCEAVGNLGGRYNGYYTWASFGADLAIPEDLTVKAQQEGFPIVNSTHELFRYPDGNRWWRENGRTSEAFFDLTEGSRHNAILRAYTRLKGVELA